MTEPTSTSATPTAGALHHTPSTLYSPFGWIPDEPDKPLHVWWYAARKEESLPGPMRATLSLALRPHELQNLDASSASALALLHERRVRELMTRAEVEVLDYWLNTRLGWGLLGAGYHQLPLRAVDIGPYPYAMQFEVPTSSLPGRHIPITDLVRDWELSWWPVAYISGETLRADEFANASAEEWRARTIASPDAREVKTLGEVLR